MNTGLSVINNKRSLPLKVRVQVEKALLENERSKMNRPGLEPLLLISRAANPVLPPPLVGFNITKQGLKS